MRINACSVAFRHIDMTAAALAEYVLEHDFAGLEIWLPHARQMSAAWQQLPRRPDVAMLAGYLPFGQDEIEQPMVEMCQLTQNWQAKRLRLFAGNVGSAACSADERAIIVDGLRLAGQIADDHGLRIAIETHPDTLADTPEMALRLLEQVDHPALGLNFDVLHIWEAGADPITAHERLRPHILHHHLKSITARTALKVFDSGNIHDPHGSRIGICPLFDGALDYATILEALPADAQCSLEWFGPNPGRIMARDLAAIKHAMLATSA